MNKSSMSRAELMRKIMEYDFALVDLKLYLNTHPDDGESLSTYMNLRDTLNNYTMEYVHRFGPINSNQVTCDSYWTWVSEPWPWEGVCE